MKNDQTGYSQSPIYIFLLIALVFWLTSIAVILTSKIQDLSNECSILSQDIVSLVQSQKFQCTDA